MTGSRMLYWFGHWDSVFLNKERGYFYSGLFDQIFFLKDYPDLIWEDEEVPVKKKRNRKE